MPGVVDIEYIRKKHLVEGWSIHRIADELHVCRQTVRRAIKDPGPWKYTLRADKPCPVMDPYRDVITQWIKDDEKAPRKQHHTASRIYHRLCDEYGFLGGESTVRRYVRRLRAALEVQNVDPFLVLEADPGEMAQIDWGTAQVYLCGIRTTIHLLCMRMKYSKVPFVWAATNERLETFLEGHVQAFNWLGGVPQEDRLRQPDHSDQKGPVRARQRVEREIGDTEVTLPVPYSLLQQGSWLGERVCGEPSRICQAELPDPNAVS